MKKDGKLCTLCGKRQAVCKIRGQGKAVYRKGHEYCAQCWEACCQSILNRGNYSQRRPVEFR